MTNDMTTGRPMPLILKFAIPLTLGNILQQLYNVVDSVVAGQFIGVDACAWATVIARGFSAVCCLAYIGKNMRFSGFPGRISIIRASGYGICCFWVFPWDCSFPLRASAR